METSRIHTSGELDFTSSHCRAVSHWPAVICLLVADYYIYSTPLGLTQSVPEAPSRVHRRKLSQHTFSCVYHIHSDLLNWSIHMVCTQTNAHVSASLCFYLILFLLFILTSRLNDLAIGKLMYLLIGWSSVGVNRVMMLTAEASHSNWLHFITWCVILPDNNRPLMPCFVLDPCTQQPVG